jgi:hypothetical protein
MREWRRRADFRRLLPLLLKGEDPDFVRYIQSLQAQESDPNASDVQGMATSATAPTVAAPTR